MVIITNWYNFENQMKTSGSRYWYFVVLLLLNAFATIHANTFNGSIGENNTENCIDGFYAPKPNTAELASFDRDYKDVHSGLFCEAREEAELEHDGFSSKRKKNVSKAGTINFAQLFKSVSNPVLQKITYRYQSNVSKHAPRLHVLFQVFII